MKNSSQLAEALKSLCLVLALAISLAAANAPQTKDAYPEIVARVNGEPVTLAEFQRMLGNPLTLRQAQREQGVEEPDRKELECLAMQRLIHFRLIIQQAERRHITVSEKEVDQAITALRRRFDDLKSFGAWVKEQGLDDPSLFETIRTDMLSNRAVAELAAGTGVPDEHVLRYYEAHQNDLTIGEQVRLRIIAVHSKPEAEEILASLRKGEKFGRLARQRSLGFFAAKGGDSGWIDSQTLPLSLRQAIAQLKVGDVGGPLEKAADEFLIVGLRGRRPIQAKSLAEARAEIERRLLPARQQEVVQAWLKEQEAKSEIKVFLQQK